MTGLRGSRAAPIGANVALLAITFAFLGPMVWMFTAAFNRTAQLSFDIPTKPTLDNFRAVATWEVLFRPLLNSLVLSLSASTVTVVTACLCAYPLSRRKLRFGQLFLYLILVASGLPVIALIIPTYRMFTKLHLTDRTPATALFLAATSLPFAVWLAKNSIDAVPIELEEAARIDGAGTGRTLLHVVLPLIRPGLTVILIFTFVANWGNFFVPYILFTSPAKQTASVTIYSFFNSLGGVYFGRVAAFAIFYSAPAILLYTMISRTFGRAFRFAGGVKG